VIQRVTFVLDSRREERIADSVWQEKNERSVVSSGHTPYALLVSAYAQVCVAQTDRRIMVRHRDLPQHLL